MASRVSVRVPIWLTLMRIELATPSRIPRLSRCVFVTNRSSPTSWIFFPKASVMIFQPAQSSSAMPSSMEMMGYCFTQFAQNSTICWGVFSLLSDFLKTYFFFWGSKNSLAAGSKARAMSVPALYPAWRIASRITSMASSLDFRFGAKPPSSPTPVAYPFFFKTLRRW